MVTCGSFSCPTPSRCGGIIGLQGAFHGTDIVHKTNRRNLHSVCGGGRMFGTFSGIRRSLPARIAVRRVYNVVRNDKGKRLQYEDVTVLRALGEGSFGKVFQGEIDGAPVVLKKVKARVRGAQQVAEMEHVLNVYASKSCRKETVAPFLGYFEVAEEDAAGQLTAGLWLVWSYEGSKTLAYYLRRRDCMKKLMEDMELSSEGEVVRAVMRQVFECLDDLHGAGLVHRDVKPANLVFSDAQKRFKIIDLGAAADLRTGTNYSPQETMLDPCYCAPEEYVLPTDSPDISQQGAMAFVMSPIVWSQHRPECFDTYSAGVVLLQLALPFLRSPSALKNWKNTMIRLNHNVQEWRSKARLSARQTALLDEDDELGWDLLEGLLRTREIQGDGRGGVTFVTRGKAPRLTPQEALKHPYLKTSTPGMFSGLFSRSASMDGGERMDEAEEEEKTKAAAAASRRTKGWKWVQDRIFDLESRVTAQASETKTQTVIVQELEEKVKQGKATEQDLLLERSKLDAMRAVLQSSMSEMGSLFASAKGLVSTSEEKEEEEEEVGESVPSTATQSKTDDGDDHSTVGRFFADAASSAIVSSLKFTGRALITVADLASSAEESLGEAQARRDAIRKEKAILSELLSRLDVVPGKTAWEDVKGDVLAILDDSMLNESQMKRAFRSYVNDILREERAKLRQLKLDFSTLLRDAELSSTVGYDAFSKDFGNDPRYISLDDGNRRSLFASHIESIKKKETMMQQREDNNTIAKAEQQEQIGRADTSEEALARIRAEQERMKSEYEEMEQKLKSMEKILNRTNLLSNISGPDDFITRDKDTITFRFSDGAPTARSSKKKK
ncbi:hypothetical protein M9434_004590 [Picochlorum sp. BPE23]|nr:hypothetical protein M9434_004590 [Picochlorum sp. BPE23]